MPELRIFLMEQLEKMEQKLFALQQSLLAISIDCSETGEMDEQTESD